MKNLFVAAFLATVMVGQAKSFGQHSEGEQSKFAVEEIPGEPRVQHTIPIPGAVLVAMQADEAVRACIKDNPLDPGKSLSMWFIASPVHLHEADEVDVVVVPSFHGEESMCFQTPAGIGLFWVFRPHGERYEMVLRTWAGGLEILKSKTGGYRNIRTGTLGQAGKVQTDLDFHFDGSHYTESREFTHQQR